MQPNTQKCTVLSVSGGIQGVMGRLETGNSEKNAQPVGVFKKMTARSGWDDQIRVFLQPRCRCAVYSVGTHVRELIFRTALYF